jgi:cytochrome c553
MLVSMLAVAATAALPSLAHADDPAPGIKSIVPTCGTCHGPKGVSSMASTPSIAAQPDVFVQYQLVFMRDGGRDPGVMKAAVSKLTDDNIRDLGAYYSSLPPPPAQKAPGEVDEAKVTALMKPRHCDSCHKEDFSGQGETARLAGQRPDYMIKALTDFKKAVRRGRGMGAMMEVSVTLQEDDIKMIATYLARKP